MKSTTLLGTWALLLLSAVATAHAATASCEGKYRGREVPLEELTKLLEQHKEYLTEVPRSLTTCRDDDHPLRANLCGAKLRELHLEGVNLSCANLQDADLTKITTRLRADGAVGTPASFDGANLRNASFMMAELHFASFLEADISGVNFLGADLRKANFASATLSGADLSQADVAGALFEPRPGTLPTISRLTDTRGLAELEFTSPHAAAELREAFKKAALRDPERRLTYILKRHEVSQTNSVERVFNWLLFDLTSQYGMSPGRPLWILLASIIILTVPYYLALRRVASGIWIVWPKDRLPASPGNDTPQQLAATTAPQALVYAIYFSLLSAASIGWKDLNVGSWLARLQSSEYSMKATGWVRTLSGAQSLLSVYLLALWALTYFGRPFE